MYGFFALSFVVSTCMAIFGLIAPQKVMFWSNNPTRAKAFLAYLFCGFFALAVAPDPPKTKNTKSNDSISTDSDSQKGSFSRSLDKKKDTTQEIVEEQKQLIKVDSTPYIYKKAVEMNKKGKYQEAVELATQLMQSGNFSDSVRLCRAKSFAAMGKKADAVAEIQSIPNYNDIPEAKKIYNKVNPLRKKLVGYHTKCCDGSISYSTGRGTCSHHKGVCGTEAEYNETREFGN